MHNEAYVYFADEQHALSVTVKFTMCMLRWQLRSRYPLKRTVSRCLPFRVRNLWFCITHPTVYPRYPLQTATDIICTTLASSERHHNSIEFRFWRDDFERQQAYWIVDSQKNRQNKSSSFFSLLHKIWLRERSILPYLLTFQLLKKIAGSYYNEL